MMSATHSAKSADNQTVTHHCKSVRWLFSLWLLLHQAFSADSHEAAVHDNAPPAVGSASSVQVQCLPDSGGYLRAHLSGSINQELSLSGAQLDCTGSIRPTGDGLRLRFGEHNAPEGTRLVLLFGISGIKEGEAGRALPVNLTVMREGRGEFYATQGDHRCTVDEIHQEPLSGIPLKQRSWRVVARGFCTQPARALNGDGFILVTRFDFAGRAEFSSEGETQTVFTPITTHSPP